MIDVDTNWLMEGSYTPFVAQFKPSPEEPIQTVLTINEDMSLSINWSLLERYVAISPIDRSASLNQTGDFNYRCMAHALLALRDGRITEISCDT